MYFPGIVLEVDSRKSWYLEYLRKQGLLLWSVFLPQGGNNRGRGSSISKSVTPHSAPLPKALKPESGSS